MNRTGRKPERNNFIKVVISFLLSIINIYLAVSLEEWTKAAGLAAVGLFVAAGFVIGLFLAAYFLFLQERRLKVHALLWGALLASSYVLGCRMRRDGTALTGVSDFFVLIVQIICLSVPAASCVAAVLNGGILTLFHLPLCAVKKGEEGAPGCSEQCVLSRKRYRTWQAAVFYTVLIFVCWVPVFLAYYPSVFAYDAEGQLYQVIAQDYSTHHPLLHTLFLGGFFQLGGKVFGSYQTGMALHSLVQMMMMAAVFGYTLACLYRKGASRILRVMLFCFYGLFPTNSVLAVSTTKDVLFAALVLLYTMSVYRMAEYVRADSSMPAGHTGADSSMTAGHAGTDSYMPAGHTGTDSCLPAGHAGADSSMPAGHTGTDSYMPAEHARADSVRISGHSGKDSGETVCPDARRYPVSNAVVYILWAVLMLLFRNNVVYAFVVSVPLVYAGLHRAEGSGKTAGTVPGQKKRLQDWRRRVRSMRQRYLLCSLAALVLFGAGGAALKAVTGAHNGSPREMLSVPLQQMARTRVKTEETLPSDMRQELDKYIPAQWVFAAYNPYLADPVKNRAVIHDDPAGLIKTWVRLGVQYPQIYIDAFLDNSIGYWFIEDRTHAQIYGIGTESGFGYLSTDNRTMPAGCEIEQHSLLPGLRAFMERIVSDNVYQKIPVLRIIFAPAFYWWMLCMYMAAAIYGKRYTFLLPAAFLAAYYMTLLLSPTVLIRYMYPFVVTVPALCCSLLTDLTNTTTKIYNKN